MVRLGLQYKREHSRMRARFYGEMNLGSLLFHNRFAYFLGALRSFALLRRRLTRLLTWALCPMATRLPSHALPTAV